VHPPLARHDSSAKEIANHTRPVQARPVDQAHELLHLASVFWSVCLANPLLRNIVDVAECGAAWFLPDVELSLIPFSQRCILGATEIVILESIVKIEVYSTYNLRASNRPFLPQAKQVLEQIKVSLNPHKRLAKVNEGSHKKN
jgi:hypothetical protein